jgi:SAM-dependent methyltransferase
MGSQSLALHDGPVELPILEQARNFVRFLSEQERALRKTGSTTPPQAAKQAVAERFWQLFDAARQAQPSIASAELAGIKERFRTILMPWLCKSRYHCRSIVKPQGYSGDFMIIEWMYDLEGDACESPHQAAIVNCLDYAFSTIDSVIGVWERRAWLRDLTIGEMARGKPFAMLDVACGGARYIRDALDRSPARDNTRFTLVDQDPEALDFARTVNLSPFQDQLEAICVPIRSLAKVLSGRQFDMIVCSGLFDYLGEFQAGFLLKGLTEALRPGGLIAITNFHPQDRSATIKDWGADWQIVFRDEPTVAKLFAQCGLQADIGVSSNGSLTMASARKPS